MVIFMPHYRQHGQLFHSHSRARPSASSNGQNNITATIQMNRCKFASNMLCRFIFSIFLLAISIFLFRISIDNISNKREGSNIVAAILLIIAIIVFIRTCQKVRRYYIIMNTRQRLIQRLRERQQAYDLAVALNNEENPSHVTTDLPTYKQLFPSHPDLRHGSTDSSSTLPPPSYDDFVKTLVIRHPTTNIPVTSVPQLQTTPTRCLWITDRTQRPLCIRGAVTYV